MIKIHQIFFPDENIVIPCRDNQTVYDAIDQSGKLSQLFGSGCRGGGCGICKVVVRQGQVTVIKKMSRAHVAQPSSTQNSCVTVLSCCVVPRENLLLELAGDLVEAGQST